MPLDALSDRHGVVCGGQVREQGGWPTFLRTPRGREEKAACGQLATEGAKVCPVAILCM